MAKATTGGAHSGYVGAGSRLNGRLHAPGPFSVAGKFSGEIHSQDVVSVGNEGYFEGEIIARRIVVESGGTIAGKIAAENVEVRAGGAIAGVVVKAASLNLEAGSNADGAEFDIQRGFRPSLGTEAPSAAPSPADSPVVSEVEAAP